MRVSFSKIKKWYPRSRNFDDTVETILWNKPTFFSSIALSRKSRSQLDSGVSFILQTSVGVNFHIIRSFNSKQVCRFSKMHVDTINVFWTLARKCMRHAAIKASGSFAFLNNARMILKSTSWLSIYFHVLGVILWVVLSPQTTVWFLLFKRTFYFENLQQREAPMPLM